MKTLLQLFLLLFVSTLSAAAQNLPSAAQQKALPEAVSAAPAIVWREVVEPQRGFKISLPGEPSRNVERQSGDYQMQAYGDGIACLLLHLRGPEVDEREAETDEFWKGFSREVAGDTNAQILSETPIRFEGHPGREYRLKIGDVLTIGRIYVVGHDAYCLFVADMNAQDASPKTARFLDSFRLTAGGKKAIVSLPSIEWPAEIKLPVYINPESVLQMRGPAPVADDSAPSRARIPMPRVDLRANIRPVAFQPVMLGAAFQKLLSESSPMAAQAAGTLPRTSHGKSIKPPVFLSPELILKLCDGLSPAAPAMEIPPPPANRQ
jgi:hypothetical protein